jgi:hypothetical protein
VVQKENTHTLVDRHTAQGALQLLRGLSSLIINGLYRNLEAFNDGLLGLTCKPRLVSPLPLATPSMQANLKKTIHSFIDFTNTAAHPSPRIPTDPPQLSINTDGFFTVPHSGAGTRKKKL